MPKKDTEPFSMLKPGEKLVRSPGGNMMIQSAFFAEPRTVDEVIHWMFNTNVERTRRIIRSLGLLNGENDV